VGGSFQDAVAEVIARGRTAWPAFSVDPSALARHVTDSVTNEPDPVAAVRELVAADLYLAFGCAAGDPGAIAVFEEKHMPEVAAYIARTDPDPVLADEVRQVLRQRLLVGDGTSGPKIASYSGRGPLGAWLRTVAVRVTLELVRSRRPHTQLRQGDVELRAIGADPELDYLKTRYAREVGDAFATVLGALEHKQRNILRLYFLEGMTIEAIAAVYRVHRMTISRWIATWRDEIYAETQRLLRARLKVSPEELDSLLRLVQSRIDVSIRRYLT
jgi:RNA polymerase sigma-70 factor, ECF subfamily